MNNIKERVEEILRGYLDFDIILEDDIENIACDVETSFREMLNEELRISIAISMIEVILESQGGTSKGWIEPTVKEAFKCADEILTVNKQGL